MPFQPLISVLMPAWNSEGTISRALNSIRAQTLTDYEFVVVDDGSTDSTRKIMRQFAADDDRIILSQQPHGGIVAALNAGLELCSGEYIARMDADDYAHPDRLALQLKYMTAHPETGVLATCANFIASDGRSDGYRLFVEWNNSIIEPAAILLNRFIESPVIHPTVMFRHDLISAFGGYADGVFPEDYELWLRWMEEGVVFGKLPEVLLDWYDEPLRLSRKNPRYSVDSFYAMKSEHLGRWLAVHNPHHPEITVWGAGRISRKRAELLTAEGVKISRYVDIDPDKIGQHIAGSPIIHPEELPSAGTCFVVSYVGSRGARELISEHLVSARYIPGIHFICAA